MHHLEEKISFILQRKANIHNQKKMANCKALLCGINYTGTANELNGCQNDVQNVLKYLKERFKVVNEIRLYNHREVQVTNEDAEKNQENKSEADQDFQIALEKGWFLQFIQGLVEEGDVLAEGSGRSIEEKVHDMSQYAQMTNADMAHSTVDVLILTDDQRGKHLPTKQNILNGFKWLTTGATSASHLFFHYSGHGSYQKDTNGDEEDGRDESLVPLDFASAGCLLDDVIRQKLVDPLPKGCELRCLFDCCHSASGADLKYCYRDFDVQRKGQKALHTNIRQKETECNVISWSGCRDNQTSADAFIGGAYAGALTAHFLDLMRDQYQDKSYKSIYIKLLTALKKGGYTQKPQLSCGKPIDLDSKFDLF